MTRFELMKAFVLNEVGDDYEERDMIASGVRELGEIFSVNSIEISEVEQAIVDLIREGLIKAYDLRTLPVTEFQGLPPELVFPYYYLQTSKGREVHALNWTKWPLCRIDEE